MSEGLANYDQYLDGHLWPRVIAGSEIHLVPVETMVPAHACNALHQLLRTGSQWASTEHQEEQDRARLRNTELGKALTAQAIGLRDFAPDEDPSLKPFLPLEDVDVAKVLTRALFDVLEALDPMQAAACATQITQTLSQQGYRLMKEQ